MADLLATQLDFILFFYGLAFILFGATCLALSRLRRRSAWHLLAAFGLIHGAGEWLDLTALVTGDSPGFAAARLVPLTLSFLCLLDFARMEAIALGLKLPGRWFGIPLLLIVALTWYNSEPHIAAVVARYSLGLPAAIGAALVTLRRARNLGGRQRLWTVASGLGFLLYGLATGLVVPEAPYWPASVINTGTFVRSTGVPIQLVRALLACWLSLCAWAVFSHIAGAESGSERYAAFLRRLFKWTMAALAATLVAGWVLTQFLGALYRTDIEAEAEGDITVLSGRLTGEATTVEAIVDALAGNPEIVALANGAPANVSEAPVDLSLGVNATGSQLGFVLDATGRVLISDTSRSATASAARFAASPAFSEAMAGRRGYWLAYDPATNRRELYVGAPIRDDADAVIGVVVVQHTLEKLEADLRAFDRPYFLIDPQGIVVLTNRPELTFRPLWPIGPESVRLLQQTYPDFVNQPLLPKPVAESDWTTFDGERALVKRRFAEQGDWSIVMALPPTGRYASRILGIVITLLLALVALTYFFGRERHVHDSVEMERRLELQLLAQDLRSKAHTDSLTGLYNRLRFDHSLVEEIARAERYHMPLSAIIFDIDHFKRVNDGYGHPVGDQVLIRLSRLAAANVRSTDVLARWGGEEFVLLLPGCDLSMGKLMAEKLRAAIATAVFESVGRVTCSFGVAQFQVGDGPQSLIARADEALNLAKANGRNRVEGAALMTAAE